MYYIKMILSEAESMIGNFLAHQIHQIGKKTSYLSHFFRVPRSIHNLHFWRSDILSAVGPC